MTVQRGKIDNTFHIWYL